MPFATQPFASRALFEAEVGRDILDRCLDDNRDGYADADIVTHYLTMGQSYVEGFLRPVYGALPLTFDDDVVPDELVRFTLDSAKYRLWRRHREIVMWDADDMKQTYAQTRAELMDLRKGVTRLNVTGHPETEAKNKGGIVHSDNPRDPGAPKRFFGDMGDF